MKSLKLQNVEDFDRVDHARINFHSLTVKLIVGVKINGISRTIDWVARNERGDKMIFGREFGKGGKWIKD